MFTAAFSSDGRPLVIGRVGKDIGLWDVATDRELYRFDESELLDRFTFHFFSDGNLLLIERPTTCEIISLKESNVAVRGWKGQADWSDSILGISADNKIFAACAEVYVPEAGRPGFSLRQLVIQIWEIGTGKKLRQFAWTNWKRENAELTPFIEKAALSPDGRILAVKGSEPEEVTLWATATGKKLHRIKDSGECSPFAFSPDGKTPAWFSRGKSLSFHLCEVARGKVVSHTLSNRAGDHLLKGEGTPVCLVWSPDGGLLATADEDGTIYLLDAATGEERGRLRGHQAPLRTLAFSADGKRLLSACEDRTALVWDVRQGLHTKR